MKQKYVNTGPSLFLNRLLVEVKKQSFEKEFKARRSTEYFHATNAQNMW